jgi:hypothetical protein
MAQEEHYDENVASEADGMILLGQRIQESVIYSGRSLRH